MSFKLALLGGATALFLRNKFPGLLSPSFYLHAAQRVHPQVLRDIVDMYVDEKKKHSLDRFFIPYAVLKTNVQAAEYESQTEIRPQLPEDVRPNQVTAIENGRRIIYELRY